MKKVEPMQLRVEILNQVTYATAQEHMHGVHLHLWHAANIFHVVVREMVADALYYPDRGTR